jgi:hypothetical protein
MKIERSFLLSMVLHAGIISGAVALSSFFKEEKRGGNCIGTLSC